MLPDGAWAPAPDAQGPKPSAHDAARSSPLRVLMVLESDFTQRGGGGAESQVRTLALRLLRLGHQASVLTPHLPYSPPATVERCYGIPVARLRYPRRSGIGAAVMCARLAVFLCRHGQRYDAWHVHIGHRLGAVTCLIGSLTGKPVVVKISGWWELEKGVLASGSRSPLDWIAKRWLKKASAVQAISSRIAAELSRHGFPAERVIVLPNAVDTSRFNLQRGARAPGAPFTAVFVGRLVEEKGLRTLFEAWAQAFVGRSDVRLLLVGGGPLETELRGRAAELGIAAQIEFLGHRDHVEEILTGADVGLLPSRIEGLSNTLLEYMASGMAAIASRVSGSEDFVRPGRNGWLFPVSDVAALADCFREARATSPEQLLALGRQARADVEAAASLDRVVGRLLTLYRPSTVRGLESRG